MLGFLYMKILLLCLVFFPIVIAGCGDKKLVNDTAKPQTIFDETMGDQMLSEKDEHTLTESIDKEQGEFNSGVNSENTTPAAEGKVEAINAEKLDFRGDLLNEIVYLNGSLYTGKSFSLQANGKKRTEGSYVNGKQDGLWIEWNEDGQKQSEDNYKKGKFNGLRVGWHPNGQKAMEGTWRDGNPYSKQIWWHSNGQKKSEAYYEKGKIISDTKFWNSKGEPVNSFAEANKK